MNAFATPTFTAVARSASGSITLADLPPSSTNGTPYGLAGAVWSGDQEHAVRVARQLRAWQVEINGGAFNVAAPFGGFGQSGYGRELGVHGLEEFLEVKALLF